MDDSKLPYLDRFQERFAQSYASCLLGKFTPYHLDDPKYEDQYRPLPCKNVEQVLDLIDADRQKPEALAAAENWRQVDAQYRSEVAAAAASAGQRASALAAAGGAAAMARTYDELQDAIDSDWRPEGRLTV